MERQKYNTPYSAREKEKALKLWRMSTVEFVCHRYHCSERSLWRWKKRYDGTPASLANGSSVPHTPHPNRHTDEEIRHIQDLVRRNPHIGLNELYGKLRLYYAYTRNPVSLYRLLRKRGYYNGVRKARKAYVPKPYHTPLHIGEKWQMDVKRVPWECATIAVPSDCDFYQYTVIDEATRERFIHAYKEQCAESTVDFVVRAILYFRYKPKIIQTDNGQEFTYLRQVKADKVHLLDKFCEKHKIEHKTIKPRTPRHNGKVERSHRNDNERFYRRLKFYSFDDLQSQMKAYLQRSNNIPMSTLYPRGGRKSDWLTPKQKRAELLKLDYGITA
ncbi:MAG: DDE-type integrase/transposase/recombinase [Clostridiales bacterium]|jgi:transposase InsO family protein|nr:DDE-type integrase/transposase/recombinase [Clostridiales bacterium]